MSTFIPHYFEELKSCVITTTGLTNITPCDCKTISLQILNKTRQRISETTLKRVYGFAYSKFKPSLFTIDVLAHYCGFKSWDDFCETQEKNNVKTTSSSSLSWETLKHNAGKITSFTLQALKNKSGIPYNQTIKRKFIDGHFDAFLNENCTGTVFSAPAGYGKTIGLCHWIDERLESNAKGETNDIILFFSSNALINVFLSGRDINEWLLALLGYSPEDDVASLLNDQAEKGGKFFLIIDGFDEHMFKAEQFEIILNQIVDVFSLYQSHNWFKLVLTMRLASWINYKHEIDSDHNRWFMGFPAEGHDVINVPMFNIEEIKDLSKKLNPAAPAIKNLEAAGKFNHPLYFQFYYKNHKDDFSLNHIDHICIYDLISTFILNKVYLGAHSAEKILLLKELVEEMDFRHKQYAVSKLKVNNLIRQYSHAYQELLSVGFLKETNQSSDIEYNTFIQFNNNDFLEYMVAKKVLLDNDYVFNRTLIKNIDDLFADDEVKLPILKWCIIYALKSDQEDGFLALEEVELTFKEKADLIVFLAELFEKECFSTPQNESIKNYVKQNCLKGLFNYFIGIEFIDPEYEKTLHILLKFDLDEHHKILVHTCLAMVAIIRMDLNRLEAQYLKLKSFSNSDYSSFPLNPLNCVACIYYYFRYGIIKKDFLTEVTRFIFNPLYGGEFKKTPVNDIVFVLSAYASIINNNPKKSLRFIDVVKKQYKDSSDVLSSYGFFMNITSADRYFLLGETEKGYTLYKSMEEIYNGHQSEYTPIMQMLYIALKIKVSLFKKTYDDLLSQIKYMHSLAERTGYRLSILYIYKYLLKNREFMEEHPYVEKQFQYEYRKVAREVGIRPEIFLNQSEFVKVESRD